MVEVGDRILVESEKVGTVTRSGVVTAVEDANHCAMGLGLAVGPRAKRQALRVTGHEPPAEETEGS
jgi:co-chaperonin GroES (HSP10)